MTNHIIHIRMLGSFEISLDNRVIRDSDNRSRKLWMLLAFLIYHRGQHISQAQLWDIIWGDDDNTNPASALKTLSHRARILLDDLGDDTGKQILVCKKGEYYFNTELSYTLDIDVFEQTLNQAKQSKYPAEKRELLTQAVSLYSGDFLTKFSTESWIIPIATYYHNLYLDAVETLLLLLEADNAYDEAITICVKANTIEPCDERLHMHLMKNLICANREEEAIRVYKEFSEMLSSTFGVKPSDEVRQLYRQAVTSLRKNSLEIEEVQNQLTEETDAQTTGALFCDYELFCAIYHALSRGLERNGNVVHLAVLTITDLTGNELNARSLSVCTSNLKTLICNTLRQGDILSMCSPSQFALMLPNANREDSDKVLTRIEKKFLRQYPHTPARLSHVIQPVLPVQLKKEV